MCTSALPQLKPGYDGVPKLLAAFEKGIPHKVAADTAGQLVFMGSTEVGGCLVGLRNPFVLVLGLA